VPGAIPFLANIRDIMRLIKGNSYPVKEQIKAMGGTWNPRFKAWSVPDEKGDEAQALVNAQGESTFVPRPSRGNGSRSRYRSNYTRYSSGAESFTNKRGRCEDAPCCGCCS
jgi:hypothetical protein